MRSYRNYYGGNRFLTRQAPRAVSGSASPSRARALEFGTIAASSWRCSGLLPGVSPVFDRTETTTLGEIVSPLARPPELSLGALPPREHALEFGTITASSWRCSGLLPRVSPVFDRTETILGEIVSPLARLPGLSLGALPPREHALEFGTIAASSWRCSGLIPGVSPVFDRTQTILGELVSPLAYLPERSLGALPPREHDLEFGTITASSWRCSGLLPGVSPVFDRTQTILGEIGSPLARPSELSLGALPPREHALEFGTITASSWRCSGLLPLPTCATPHALSREHVLTELSLRPNFECRVLRNSFGAHAGWLRDRRGAPSLKLLFCRLPVFNVDKQLDVWDVRADTWG